MRSPAFALIFLRFFIFTTTGFPLLSAQDITHANRG
jgi:hypothetical protein